MCFEFRLPALPRIELLGALIRSKDGEGQAPEALSSPSLLGGLAEGMAHTLPLCFPRHGENRHVAMDLIREIVAPSIQEQDADDTEFWVGSDQEGRARRRMVERPERARRSRAATSLPWPRPARSVIRGSKWRLGPGGSSDQGLGRQSARAALEAES